MNDTQAGDDREREWIREAQQHAGHLPGGLRLSEASREGIDAAIAEGKAADADRDEPEAG